MAGVKSPFPGMEPYLERFWNNVHLPLITYIADELNERLPARLRATLQKRDLVEGFADHSRKEYSVEVVGIDGEENPVAAIEIRSPENKRLGDGMLQFEAKRSEYWRAGVSRVEIDLLREGHRPCEFPLGVLERYAGKGYYIGVYRGHRPNTCELYAIDLRDPLSEISVPLRQQDPDVRLDLQSLMEHVYRTGRFPIDYDDPCDPPLEGDDAVWARGLLDARETGT